MLKMEKSSQVSFYELIKPGEAFIIFKGISYTYSIPRIK